MDELEKITVDGYRILAKLGQGGGGTVFKAEDPELNRQVAIKFLFHSKDQDPRSLILSEARKLASINHNNVVRILELNKSYKDGIEQLAIVMEYLSGSTLAQLNKEQLLSPEQKLNYLMQIASGMAAIHQQGLVHGDLKAENVWITEDNTVKLIDFGLSINPDVEKENNAHEAYFSASLATLTPEICKGEKLSQQSDIFTFGCLACNMLTGYLPYNAASFEQRVNDLKRSKSANISEQFPTLPVSLSRLLEDCLQINPNKRVSDFNQLHEQLSRVLEHIQQENIANNDTIVLSEDLAIGPAKNRYFKPAIAAVLVMMTILVIFTVNHLKPDNIEEQSVLLLAPEIVQSDQLHIAQGQLVKAVIDDALRQAVLQDPNHSLISRSEIAGVDKNPVAQAKATGADIVVVPLLDCIPQSCKVSVEILDSQRGNVTNIVSWNSPNDTLVVINETTQRQISTLFPNMVQTDIQQFLVTEAQFEKYIQLYNDILFGSDGKDELFVELTNLLREAPNLTGGYHLHRETALRLFRDSGDPKYLDTLEASLMNSPPEYKNSLTYIWDEFMLRLYRRNFDLAEKLIKLAKQRGHSAVAVKNLQAAYSMETNDYESAKRLYTELIKHRYSDQSLYNLALSHWYLSEYDSVIVTLNDLLAISPNNHSAKQLIGTAYLIKGRLQEAITIYLALISERPSSLDLSNLSIAYLLLGEMKEAHFYATKAVQLNPKNESWRLNLADINNLMGNNEEAIRSYEDILSNLEDKHDIDALLTKAQAQVHLGQHLASVRTINKINKLSPDDPEADYISALIYTIQGEHTSALIKVEEALDSGINVIWFHLPWFSPLCEYSHFAELMNTFSGNQQTFCS